MMNVVYEFSLLLMHFSLLFMCYLTYGFNASFNNPIIMIGHLFGDAYSYQRHSNPYVINVTESIHIDYIRLNFVALVCFSFDYMKKKSVEYPTGLLHISCTRSAFVVVTYFRFSDVGSTIHLRCSIRTNKSSGESWWSIK